MKKVFFIGLALVIITAAFVMFNLGFLVKGAVNRFGSEITGSDVTLSSLDISLLSGKARAEEFRLGNPEGFQSPTAFHVSAIDIDLVNKSLSKDVIIIDRIEITAPLITYEKTTNTDNFKQILDHIKAFIGEGTPEEESPKGSGRKILIRDLFVKGGKVNLSFPKLSKETIQAALPDIHLENVGGKDMGAPPAEVFEKILGAIYEKILSPGKGKSVELQLESLKSKVNTLNEDVKKEAKKIEGSVINMLNDLKP